MRNTTGIGLAFNFTQYAYSTFNGAPNCDKRTDCERGQCKGIDKKEFGAGIRWTFAFQLFCIISKRGED